MRFEKEQAIAAIQILKEHLNNDRHLDRYQIETCRQIIKPYAKSFWFFTRYILGLNRYPKTHATWCNKQETDFFKKRNFIRLKPRGTGKTTIYGVAFVLWVWATVAKTINILYSSANSLLLEEVYDSLRRVLHPDYNSLYSFIFDIRLDLQSKNTSDIINITGRGAGKGFSLTLRPAGGSTAGVHPNIIIVDDPCDKNDRTSAATRRDKKIWADTLEPLLHPVEIDGFVIRHKMVIATFWHMDDVSNYFISQNEKLDDDEKFDIEIESVEDQSTGKSNFPDIYSEKDIASLKAKMDTLFFSCQMNNVILPEGTKIFDINKMHFSPFSEHNIKNGENFCYIDPSKGNVDSDFPATIFINKQDDKIYIFDAITEIKPFSEVLDEAVRMCKAYGVKRIVFEDNGTNLIEEAIGKRVQELNSISDDKYYCEVSGVNERRNKQERIRNMSPVLFSGDVLFRKDWESVYAELINQIIYFPAWGHDDFPDVVEKAVRDLVLTVDPDKDLNSFTSAFSGY